MQDHRQNLNLTRRAHRRFRRIAFAATLLFALAGCGARSETKAPAADKGRLDLRGLSQAEFSETVSLSGEWEFYPNRLAPPEVFAPDYEGPRPPAGAIQVPGKWNAAMPDQNAVGAGTYRLVIDLPRGPQGAEASASVHNLALRLGWIASAARIYANGRIVYGDAAGGGGIVAENRKDYQPFKGAGAAPLGLQSGGRLELIIHAANFHDRDGGVMQAPALGPARSVLAERERAVFRDAFLAGSIFLIGLYHLGLFLNRRDDWPALWFGFFCLVIAARVLLTGEYFIQQLTGMAYLWQIRAEILSFYVAMPLFIAYLNATFPLRYSRYADWFFAATTAMAAALTLILPMPELTHVLTPMMVVLALGLIYGIANWVIAVVHGRTGARMSLAGGLVFAATIVNDMLHAQGYIHTAWIMPFGLFVFIFSQSYILARVFAATYRSVRSLAEALALTRDAYARFVPMQFLNQLGETDITAIRLGQQVQREMTVLFTDIRSFTGLSERMSPKENFNFLNSYLQRMAPIVQQNDGIVDKYIGDAIMALFPTGPDAALRSAIAMQRELRNYNHDRVKAGYDPIRVGMGLHHGALMLGTIGAEDRMQGTVISDAVNLASRIEDLTKVYDARILISEAVYASLEAPERYRMRLVDRVRVKGKQSSVAVYEVVEGVAEYLIELFERTRQDFDRGIVHYRNGDVEQARRCMLRVLETNPNDRAAQLYLERFQRAARRPGEELPALEEILEKDETLVRAAGQEAVSLGPPPDPSEALRRDPREGW